MNSKISTLLGTFLAAGAAGGLAANVAAGQDLSASAATGSVEVAGTANPYVPEAAGGIATLQAWYLPNTGFYQATGWWNSANVITVLADFAKLTGSKAYAPVFQNTFAQAQKLHPGFINHFYDDEGWWALAWIDAYDVTTDPRYLAMAQSIFVDMAGGWDTGTCGGGIWWSKDRAYKNAIANELFLSIAAQLADRIADPTAKAQYLSWARAEWQWFAHSGMIDQDHLVNDGLNSANPAHCVNNGQAVWSYNQGVVLGGLTALHVADHADPSLLPAAQGIADAALLHLTDANGVLHDQGEAHGGPNGGGVQFKGIFARNLLAFDQQYQTSRYGRFFTVNADSIWNNARGENIQFGSLWAGPYAGASASSQSAALDALIAAAATVQARHAP